MKRKLRSTNNPSMSLLRVRPGLSSSGTTKQTVEWLCQLCDLRLDPTYFSPACTAVTTLKPLTASEMILKQPIESAVWSPVDSCLVASVSGSQVSIWDLRRKIQAPAGTVSSPNQDKYSVVSWAKDGALVVGDRNGRVQIIKVEGLPLPSFFQQRSLCSSLRRALRVTKPELYKALRNLGKPF